MLIDFHMHIFHPKVAARALAALSGTSGLSPLTNGEIDDTLEKMAQWGVDRGVMLPIATKPSQHAVINDYAKALDGERIIAFGSVFPTAPEALPELDRIAAMGLHGVKLHPDYQGYDIDDPRLDPVYDRLCQLELPVTFHAGWDCVSPEHIHCTPSMVKRVRQKFPKMRIILAHLGGNDLWQQVEAVLAGQPGELYFDTGFTQYCADALFLRIIRRHGADRILFASDCPWASPKEIYEKICRLPLHDREREAIFSGNARRLLGI